MRPSEVFAQHRELIRRLVTEAGMTNPRLFGSALHGDDIEGSDLDLLIDVPDRTSLFDIVRLQILIEDHIKVPVHLLTPEELPLKYRGAVLQEALPL